MRGLAASVTVKNAFTDKVDHARNKARRPRSLRLFHYDACAWTPQTTPRRRQRHGPRVLGPEAPASARWVTVASKRFRRRRHRHSTSRDGRQPIGSTLISPCDLWDRCKCTVKVRRFDTRSARSAKSRDAIIASIAIARVARRVGFHDRYYRTPERFVAQRSFRPRTSHQSESTDVASPSSRAARISYCARLRGDALHRHQRWKPRSPVKRARPTSCRRGIALSLWLTARAPNAAASSRRAFKESRYFFEGVGIAEARQRFLRRVSIRAVPAREKA